jgi:guanylate kinase
MTKNRIIICGGGGSGKDHLKQRFINKGFKPSISYTTRPPREDEINGKDYIFLDVNKFKEMIEDGKFYEYKLFNNWYYGTIHEEFNTSDIFIMTPPAIELLSKEIRETSMIVYIDIDESIRAKRLANRNDADSVKRRILADREMFEFFTDYDIIIRDPNF